MIPRDEAEALAVVAVWAALIAGCVGVLSYLTFTALDRARGRFQH